MMVDYAPISDAELETGPQPSPGIVGDGTGILSGAGRSFEPVNDNDIAPQSVPFGTYSPRVIERLRNGQNANNPIGKFINGFSTGYGDSYTAGTADDFETIRKFVGAQDSEGGGVGSLRMYGQALLNDMARIKAGVLSVFPAAISGMSQAAGAVAEQVKPGSGSTVASDTEHNLNIFATDAGINMMLLGQAQYAEATRPMRGPGGGYFDQRIGPVPTHTEAAAQAAQVAEHYGLPDAAPAITAAYDKGVLPTEIFHDAKTNPSVLGDLAAGEVPKAYPVQDWTGAEMVPTAAPEGRTAAEAPAAGETAPKPPTPTGRLPAGAPRPIQGTGETKTLSLAESTEAAAINAGLAQDFGELPTYQAVKDTDQGAMALKFLKNDPEAAMDVAMGTRAAPRGMLPEAAYVAVKNKAVAEGDVDTIRNLATQSNLTQQAKTMGQRISYLRNVNPENDPVAAIQQVQEARAAALKAKGVDVAANENEAAAEYAPIRAATRAAKGPDAWAGFLKSITCAE